MTGQQTSGRTGLDLVNRSESSRTLWQVSCGSNDKISGTDCSCRDPVPAPCMRSGPGLPVLARSPQYFAITRIRHCPPAYINQSGQEVSSCIYLGYKCTPIEYITRATSSHSLSKHKDHAGVSCGAIQRYYHENKASCLSIILPLSSQDQDYFHIRAP